MAKRIKKKKGLSVDPCYVRIKGKLLLALSHVLVCYSSL